jgi:diguanylate cyclase (GGDEF)-like protein
MFEQLKRIDRQNAARIFNVFIAVAILVYLSRINYPLFHTLTEIFSCTIAFTLFLIMWNSIKYVEHHYFLIVGIAYFFVGIIDLLHAMTFKGINMIPGTVVYTTQLWIAARTMEAAALLSAPLIGMIKPSVKLPKQRIFLFFSVTTGLIFLSIFKWEIFPVCFDNTYGLTDFKIYSEYGICAALTASLYFLSRIRNALGSASFKTIFLSVILMIFSELSFTLYIDHFDILNMSGHILKILSFYVFYRALVVKAIVEPQDILFRNISMNQKHLIEQNSVLKDQAAKDPMTGLYNKRFIRECIDNGSVRGGKEGTPFCVIMIDADHFKSVNDTYGHPAGDSVLIETAEILTQNTRQTDIVGRYGGEEFIIFLFDTKLHAAISAAEKIRKAVEDHVFSGGIRITASLGVEENSGEIPEETIRRADEKLYYSKKAGRNRTTS